MIKELDNAFKSSDQPEELDKKLQTALYIMSKTPTGRNTLKSLDEAGYKMVFVPELRSFHGQYVRGLCISDQKLIALNPDLEAQDIPSIAVHETQHILQNKLDPKNIFIEKTQTSDMFKLRRAMEADACAHQAAFANEANSIGVEIKAVEGYEKIYTAYNNAIKSGDKNKAMNAAFKEWYTIKNVMNFYDKYYTNAVCMVADRLSKKQTKDQFKGEKKDKNLTKLFLFEGKPYIEPEFFSSPEAFSLRNSDKKKIVTAMKAYAKTTGSKPDTSVMAMFTSGPQKKTVKEKAVSSDNKAALSVAIQKKQAAR